MFAQENTGRAVRVAPAPRFVPSLPPPPKPTRTRNARFWIETITLVGAISCALALLIAILGAVTGAAAREPESAKSQPSSSIATQTYEGMVTDTRCGAKHSATIGRTATDCTIMCVRAGEKFVLIDGDTSYALSGDLVALKRAAGQRAKIIGTLNGKTISVHTVVTLNAAS